MDTRDKALLSGPDSSLYFWRVVFYAGIKIFNSLPSSILNLRDHKFYCKVALLKYLIAHFYLIPEFLSCIAGMSLMAVIYNIYLYLMIYGV